MRTVVAAVYGVLVALLALLPSTTSGPEPRIAALAPVEVWAGGLATLRGLVVDDSGAVFVADHTAGTLVRIATDRTATIVARDLERPAGLALDRERRLLVAEERAGRVVRVGAGGGRTILIPDVEHPRWLARGDDGTVYVSARRLGRQAVAESDDESSEPEMIVARSPAGRVSVFADGFAGLLGLAVQRDAVYAATQGLRGAMHVAGEVFRIPILADGTAGSASLVGPIDGLTKPVGIAVDRLQALYVTTHGIHTDDERSRRAVAKIHPGGRMSVFASDLDDPQGLAFDHDGDLYVADGQAGRVWRFRAPEPPKLEVPAAVNSSHVSIRGEAQAGARVDVFLNDATTAVAVLADASGAFSVEVLATANQANRIVAFATAHGGDGLTSAPAAAIILHDAVAPAVAFTHPDTSFVRRTVAVGVAAGDDGSGVATLDVTAAGRSLQPTLSPPLPASAVVATASWDTTTHSDGVYTLAAQASDLAGNAGAATRTVVVDNTPPDTEITDGPADTVAEATATFVFAGTDNFTAPPQLTFSWRLDGGAWSVYSSTAGATLTGLAEGMHTLEVRARDLAANQDPSPATRAFTVTLRPVIAAITPAHAPVGMPVAISGTGFGPAAPAVTFNGTAARVRTATGTTLTVSVPPGATTGPLTVATPRGTATAAFAVDALQDFELRVTPDVARVVPGTVTRYAVELVSTGATRFTGLASLSVDPLPVGLTATVGPAAVGAGQPATLSIGADASAAPASARIAVRATAVTDAGAVARAAAVTIDVLPAGRTALAGRFLLTDGAPVSGVRLELAGQRTLTDTAGNFLFVDVPAGTQPLMIDANAALGGLPIYAIEVTLIAGQPLQLGPLRLTPPPAPERFTAIDNARTDQIITDARFPGFSLTLPAGVTVTGWDGTLKHRIAIERLLPDALAVPPPPFETRSFYQVFFGTPMGGLPSATLPVSLPNDQDLDPGDKAELWYYDAAPLPGVRAGWRLAGEATVSADGRSVVADPGVGLERFCGVCGVACINAKIATQPNLNPLGPRAGEPVDLRTGVMVVDKTDLFIAGRLPLALHRTYNPFDPFGRVAGFELTTGPGWTLSYDVVLLEAGTEMRRLVLPGNARFRFSRQADGTFASTGHPDFAGARLIAEADGGHRLQFRDGATWRFAPGWIPRGKSQPIAGLGLLVEQRDRNGNTLAVSRDVSGGIRSVTDPGGRRLTFTTAMLVTGDPTSARLTEVTDPLGRAVRYGYDGRRRLTTVTDAAGGVTRYTYDADGGILTVTDPRGITFVTNEYDGRRRVRRQVQADGGEWAFVYEGPTGAHSAATVIDPRGNATIQRMTPDGFGSAAVDALGKVTRYERDAAGNLVSVTDPLGRVTRFEYDGAGNVVALTDPAAATARLTYDPVLNVATSITDAIGGVVTLDHDAAGNLTGLTDPLGARTSITRDAFGQATAVTGPLGTIHRLEYDAVGNVTALIDPLGNRVTRTYDAGSRLASQTDALGRRTAFAYDRLDHLLQLLDPAGGVTTAAYDANGNLATVTDARGHTTTHTHDAMDRLATRSDPLGRTERFEYDAGGNLLRLHDRSGRTVSYGYDAAGRRISAGYADGSSTAYVYDAADRLVQATDSPGATVMNRFDDAGHLVTQITTIGAVGYSYDALARRTAVTLDARPPIEYSYDAASRVTAITQGGRTVGLAYDRAGRRTALQSPNGVTTEYEYDPASRLAGLTYRTPAGTIGTLAYDYDAAARLARTAGTLAQTLLPPPVTAAVYDADNRQLAFGDGSMTYDEAGNLTSITGGGAVRTYVWDARNRLTAIFAPGTSSWFAYDPFGRRIASDIGGVRRDYLYDGPDVLLEAGDVADVDYLRLPALDAPVARGGEEFYLADRLGSIVGLTDTAGTLTTRYAYDPFGAAELDGSDSANPFQFTGRENDRTGLHYYRARYYAPDLHRFIAPDLVDRLGANRYLYAGNDPLNAIDPFGLDTLIIYGGFPSTGPNGSMPSAGGNHGLEGIRAALRDAREPTTIFNSGQHNEIMRQALLAADAGRPLFIVGHSVGGARALAVLADLGRLHISPTHVFVIDPFIADDAAVPLGTAVTDFYQMQSAINGRPVINATNWRISGPGIGHFTITNHEIVRTTILQTILTNASSPEAIGGRY